MRLAWRSDLDGAEQILRTPADAGDGQAAQQLGNLLAGIIRDNDALSLITRCVSYGNSTCGGT
jgi:hypothetical protein